MKAVCFIPSAREMDVKSPLFSEEGAVTGSALNGGHKVMQAPVQALFPGVSFMK
jgi:hypothetical protein